MWGLEAYISSPRSADSRWKLGSLRSEALPRLTLLLIFGHASADRDRTRCISKLEKHKRSWRGWDVCLPKAKQRPMCMTKALEYTVGQDGNKSWQEYRAEGPVPRYRRCQCSWSYHCGLTLTVNGPCTANRFSMRSHVRQPHSLFHCPLRPLRIRNPITKLSSKDQLEIHKRSCLLGILWLDNLLPRH